ncbi:hypothetical protein MTES_3225 [Microbacterium testaceum StLB037]|uniref:Uncharacterized protein n=1 Tax=Microbacterium testaceum (strain StLB037) TaxID=979556 RepID=E8NCV9_MICTS|nr:hypothetical protein MTES_3225 [Microbacterium testaceum StLB037]
MSSGGTGNSPSDTVVTEGGTYTFACEDDDCAEAAIMKQFFRVKTVRRWGVPTAGGGSMHTETKVSGWLVAYKPNGRFSCV